LPSGHARSCDWPNRFHPDRPDPTTQPAAPNRLYERIVAEFGAGKLGADVVCISDAGFVTGLAPRRYAQYGCLTNLSRLVPRRFAACRQVVSLPAFCTNFGPPWVEVIGTRGEANEHRAAFNARHHLYGF
jgi:hypothetical protein